MDRNSWVDYAKAIGILLVVYGHVARGVKAAGFHMDETLFFIIDSIIYSFHMPLFFFLSGLFFYDSFSKRGAAGLITNKIDTIIYPYIIWSLLQGGIEVILSKYTSGHVSITEVMSFAWQPRAQFWFLYALFLIFIANSIIYSILSKKATPLLLVAFGALYVLKQDTNFNFAIASIINNAIFFTLGILFAEGQGAFEKKKVPLGITLALLFICGQYIFHGPLALNHTSRGIESLLLATISVFFVSAISMLISKFEIKWLLTIGALSMPIYLMHILAGSGARVILNKVFGIESTVIHLAIGTIAGIAGPLVAHKIIYSFKLSILTIPPVPFSVILKNLNKKKIKAP